MDSPSRQTKERSIASLLKTFFHNFLNEQIVRRLTSDFTVELHSRLGRTRIVLAGMSASAVILLRPESS